MDITKALEERLEQQRRDLISAVADLLKAYRVEERAFAQKEIKAQVAAQMPAAYVDALLEKTKKLHEEMAKRQNEMTAGLIAEIRKSFAVKRSVERDGEGNIVGISEEPVYS